MALAKMMPDGPALAAIVERLVRDGWIVDGSSVHKIGLDAAKYGYGSLGGVRRTVFDSLVLPHLEKRTPRFSRPARKQK
jgi:hypothetical protein